MDSKTESPRSPRSKSRSKKSKSKSRSLSFRSKAKSVKSLLESSSVEWDIRFGFWKLFFDKPNHGSPLYARILSSESAIFLLKQFKLCNRETEGNRYLVKDISGENLLYGIEDNHCSDQLCICASSRAFTLTFFDANKRPVLRLYRPCRLNCCGLIPFCKQKIQVQDSDNKNIGQVTERFNLCQLSLKLLTDDKTKDLRVYGPVCDLKVRSYCFDDLCFEIKDKSKTATLEDMKTKERPHICKISELTSGGHVYQIHFETLEPELKSLVIGAAIMIDYYYFDNSYHEHKYHKMSNASQALPPFPLVPNGQKYKDKSETKSQLQ